MNLAEKIKHVRERRLYAQRLLRACDWLEARYLQQAELAALTPTEAVARFGLTMFSARTLVSRVRRLAGYAVVMLVCLGCAQPKADRQVRPTGTTYENTKGHQVPRPPMPRATRGGAGSEVGHVARAVAPPIGPAAPRKLTLVCDKNEQHPEAVTELWATTDFVNWTLFAESKEPVFTFFADQPQMFFDARNRLFGQVSAWASGR